MTVTYDRPILRSLSENAVIMVARALIFSICCLDYCNSVSTTIKLVSTTECTSCPSDASVRQLCHIYLQNTARLGTVIYLSAVVEVRGRTRGLTSPPHLLARLPQCFASSASSQLTVQNGIKSIPEYTILICKIEKYPIRRPPLLVVSGRLIPHHQLSPLASC